MSGVRDTVLGLAGGDERALLQICALLGAARVPDVSAQEAKLLAEVESSSRDVAPQVLEAVRVAIAAGQDPLGDAYCTVYGPAQRRPLGATYTPLALVRDMLARASTRWPDVGRVVDAGTGSGRFAIAAARALPRAEVVGIDPVPRATIMARAHVAAAGLEDQDRVRIHAADFRLLELESTPRRTLFLGNPPYVRHHGVAPTWKRWLDETATRLGYHASGLCGLHVHFLVRIATVARPGDVGMLLLPAEWMETNYGALVRHLLAERLGVVGIDVFQAEVRVFPDAQATATIVSFEVGTAEREVRLRELRRGGEVAAERVMKRTELAAARRWSVPHRVRSRQVGMVELGELCTVHRGTSTGNNEIWIYSDRTPWVPDRYRLPVVTSAHDLIQAGPVLYLGSLRRVVALPANLGEVRVGDRDAVDAFIAWAEAAGVRASYTASRRRAWWSLPLREPAPILATYMARRDPVFVRNTGARHLNIAHGLYPRERLSDDVLTNLVAFLRAGVGRDEGRTYAGGLTKFEPRDMERILVPGLGLLADADAVQAVLGSGAG